MPRADTLQLHWLDCPHARRWILWPAWWHLKDMFELLTGGPWNCWGVQASIYHFSLWYTGDMGSLHCFGWLLVALLYMMSVEWTRGDNCMGLLLWIVCQVCENSWVKLTPYTIKALHRETMSISLHKFIIKEFGPNTLHQFATAMCNDAGFLAITWDGIMYRVRNLLASMSEYCNTKRFTKTGTDRGNISNVMGSSWPRLALKIFRKITKI